MEKKNVDSVQIMRVCLSRWVLREGKKTFLASEEMKAEVLDFSGVPSDHQGLGSLSVARKKAPRDPICAFNVCELEIPRRTQKFSRTPIRA